MFSTDDFSEKEEKRTGCEGTGFTIAAILLCFSDIGTTIDTTSYNCARIFASLLVIIRITIG